MDVVCASLQPKSNQLFREKCLKLLYILYNLIDCIILERNHQQKVYIDIMNVRTNILII